MIFIKKYLVLVFLFVCVQTYAQNRNVSVIKKNAIELSVGVLNTIDFQLASVFMPELGYSRYLGNYFKIGAFYRHFKSVNTFNNYGTKIGFLPLPIFIKEEIFNNNWELELSINYAYEIQQGRNNNDESFTINQHKFFARMGVSRKVYNNFFLHCNIDVWNSNQVLMGIHYKF